MQCTLVPHPDFVSRAVSGIEVEVDLEDRDLCVTFTVTGRIADIVLPQLQQTAFRDGLWQSTCFEMFARSRGANAYREFNWSPSMQWAAYAFDDYRSGMRPLPAAEPVTASGSDHEKYWLSAGLALDQMPPPAWQLALTAIIEEKSGTKSYWALAHPPGKPDFHHPDCFALTLPAPGGA